MIANIPNRERQEYARRYAHLQRQLWVIKAVMGGVYCLVWLAMRWADTLKQAILPYTNDDWFIVGVVATIFGLGHYIMCLPLSYYGAYVLPQRFMISTQTIGAWISDKARMLVLTSLLAVVLVEVAYGLLRWSPHLWWLGVGVFMLFLSVLITVLAPVFILPLFYSVVPLGEEDAVLTKRLMRLAEKANARIHGIYRFDMSRRTKAANAAVIGLGSTRRIIIGDTLLKNFSAEEIVSILGHELGHHVHKDVSKGIIVGSLITMMGLYLASIGMLWGTGTFNLESIYDPAGIPWLALILGVYQFATLPLSNSYSRWRERCADLYTLRSIGNGKVYASALTRLANQNLADAYPEPWVEFMLYSHPSLSKRISVAESYG